VNDVGEAAAVLSRGSVSGSTLVEPSVPTALLITLAAASAVDFFIASTPVEKAVPICPNNKSSHALSLQIEMILIISVKILNIP
jgi:hypothetical protein